MHKPAHYQGARPGPGRKAVKQLTERLRRDRRELTREMHEHAVTHLPDMIGPPGPPWACLRYDVPETVLPDWIAGRSRTTGNPIKISRLVGLACSALASGLPEWAPALPIDEGLVPGID